MSRAHMKREASVTADAPREVEVKLEIDPDALDRLISHPVLTQLATAKAKGSKLHATYYDTADQALRRAGLSLRTRREGRRWVQTIKSDNGVRTPVLDRREWEVPINGEIPEPQAAIGTALEPLLANGNVREALQPTFAVKTSRTVLPIQRDGATIELVLDDVEVMAGESSRHFGEIELELKEGDPAPLFRTALELFEAAPMRLSLMTKSDRGYGLLDGAGPKPVKAERIKLAPGTPSAVGFQAIARSCLSQAIRNEAILRDTQDPEALHQFRVGLRRLRAVISLFGKMLSDEESKGVRRDLRQINHALGTARDLDVFIARASETGGHDESVAEAREQRERAYADMLTMLDGSFFRRAMLGTAAWIESGLWLKNDDPDVHRARERRIERRAAVQLSKRWKRVLNGARHLAELDPEARHRVRIEIKKLRYGAEFFGGLFPRGDTKSRRKASLEALRDLQEILGELHDIAVGGNLAARQLEREESVDQHERSLEALARAQRDYRRLAKLTPFWE